jgi:hypothetical protein
MTRVRVSATVDGTYLERARALTGARDSQLLDQALVALVTQSEAERERAILASAPYDADPDLTWESASGPDLPYDGEIPADVLALAAQRRHER